MKSANAGSILKYMTKKVDVMSKPKLSIKNEIKLFSSMAMDVSTYGVYVISSMILRNTLSLMFM